MTPEPRTIILALEQHKQNHKKQFGDEENEKILHFLQNKDPLCQRVKLIANVRTAEAARLSHEEPSSTAAMECSQCGRLHPNQEEFFQHHHLQEMFRSPLLEERVALIERGKSSIKTVSFVLQCKGCKEFVLRSDRAALARHAQKCSGNDNSNECMVCGKRKRKAKGSHQPGSKSCIKHLASKVGQACSTAKKPCKICLEEHGCSPICQRCSWQVTHAAPSEVTNDAIPRECVTCSKGHDLQRLAFDRAGVAYDVTFCAGCRGRVQEAVNVGEELKSAVREFSQSK